MSDFEPSDSESDYDEREKALLQNVRKNYQESSDESQEEVYNVGASEESDQDDIVLADSDVEEQDDDDIPNEKAWGKDKRKYYSTDYVDPDYGGFNEKDIQLAEFEEEEARKLQMKLAEQLDDDDFGLDFLKEESSKNDTVVSEVVKTDLTKLSKLEKIQFLKKESPELFSLMDDFKGKINLYKTLLLPVITKYRKGQIANCSAMDFVQIFTDLILNYCVNVYMYVLLKSTKTSITHHPVVKRLYQYRQMLGKLYPLFEETIKAQIETLLEEKESSEEIKEKKKKKLRFLENLVSTEPTTKKKRKGI
ncbi:hypothetical protein HHI36_010101 [Cryptolaemus montrouzieri]|uniref:Something about silencing protein 10 n=1 Tax=Cryptolaemus montrouzieri TaxID=559131 RepID=A0ABD2MHQ1_9CUCU